jgi:hypothetical protein
VHNTPVNITDADGRGLFCDVITAIHSFVACLCGIIQLVDAIKAALSIAFPAMNLSGPYLLISIIIDVLGCLCDLITTSAHFCLCESQGWNFWGLIGTIGGCFADMLSVFSQIWSLLRGISEAAHIGMEAVQAINIIDLNSTIVELIGTQMSGGTNLGACFGGGQH